MLNTLLAQRSNPRVTGMGNYRVVTCTAQPPNKRNAKSQNAPLNLPSGWLASYLQQALKSPRARAAAAEAEAAEERRRMRKIRAAEVMTARWAMLLVTSLIVADIAHVPVLLLPDVLLSDKLLPIVLVSLVGIGSVEAYRGAYNLQHEEDDEKQVYPGSDLLGTKRHRLEDAPGLGVFSSWIGGLPGWLSGGWWLSQKTMSTRELEDMKGRELSNGRLAMISFVGVAVAALVTGKGPITLLIEHLGDPTSNNIVQNLLK